MLGVVIFFTIIEASKTDLQQSQLATILVNSKAPLDAIFTLGGVIWRGGAKMSGKLAVVAALFILALNAAIPVLVATFPTYSIAICPHYSIFTFILSLSVGSIAFPQHYMPLLLVLLHILL